jgi:uncharacterized Zn finger protein (UPF0148 family)
MPNCPICHQPLIRKNGLLKCQICGFSYKNGQSTPLLSGYVPKTLTPKTAPADQELQMWIARVAQKLLPIYKDYDPNVKKQLQQGQQKIKQSLTDVLAGKLSLPQWFNRTRRDLGKHAIELTQILYDCLEGLQSREAREMRAQYSQALQAVQQQYNPQAAIGGIPQPP